MQFGDGVPDEPRTEGLKRQRRAYVRVAVSRPMSLTVLEEFHDPEPTTAEFDRGEPDNEQRPGTAGTYRGLVIDLSERGARCTLFVDEVAERLHPDQSVTLAFVLASNQFWLPGSIGRIFDRGPDDALEFVIHFNRPVAGAKVLRRELFAEQIRQRYMTG